jgi:hypothetical protein
MTDGCSVGLARTVQVIRIPDLFMTFSRRGCLKLELLLATFRLVGSP